MNEPRRRPAYPDYDVLDKRDSPSWDDATRAVIDDRLGTADQPAWCNPDQWRTLRALCAVIVPQPDERPRVPLAALVDRKIAKGESDGYRNARLPRLQDAWRIGLAALDDESRHCHSVAFPDLEEAARIGMVQAMEHGALTGHAWRNMPSELFFKERVLHDICTTYYSHPSTWSEIGFGGPANPRGYVRMDFNRRDPWEAIEASTGEDVRTAKEDKRAR